MVFPALSSALAAPTDTLSGLFTPGDDIDLLPSKVSDYFSQLFLSEDDFRQIPSLNVQNPPDLFADRSLVSFRAMVQDTSSSPEIYLARQSNGQFGGWGMADSNDASDVNHSDLRECTVVWAVSVPGESLWCAQETTNPHQKNASGVMHKPTRPHKYPLPETPHIGAQVKIYDPRLAGGLKASDLCTFVGILTKEPFYCEDLEPSSEIINTISTLHVLFTRETPSIIIPRNFPGSLPSSDPRKTRDELLTWIAEEALGGDKDAAEWILLSAIAKTQSRTPPIYPPSLTLSSLPAPSDPSRIPTLYHVLSLIFPIVNALPLTLNVLNTTSFCPESKNEDLHSGWLQVPPGSIYLLTESGITEGNVLDKGIQNLRAVQGMMMGQTLDYVFPFSRFTFPTDVSFLVLTSGKKSAFFQTSVNVPLKMDNGRCYDLYKPPEKINLPSNEVLERWRSLVCRSKAGNVTVDDETAQYIQEDFVKERKATTTASSREKGESMVTSDDLIHRMITAKLLALSLHEPLVTKDIWEETKTLEARRKVRF